MCSPLRGLFRGTEGNLRGVTFQNIIRKQWNLLFQTKSDYTLTTL